MAKVSVLVLDEKYHGWYLHCRSPYPRVSFDLSRARKQTRNAPIRIIPAALPSGTVKRRNACFLRHGVHCCESRFSPP